MEVRYHGVDGMRHRQSFNEDDYELVTSKRWRASGNSLKILHGALNDTVGNEYRVQIESDKPVNIFCSQLIAYGNIIDSEGWNFDPQSVLHEDYLPAGSLEGSYLYTGSHVNGISPYIGLDLTQGCAFRYNKDFVYGEGASDDDFTWTDSETFYGISLYSKMLTDCFVQKSYGIALNIFISTGIEDCDVNIKIWKKSLGAGSLKEEVDPQ